MSNGNAFLAVDVGSVRIGVAVCEHLELPAMPLLTIEHTSRAADVARIVRLAAERRVGTIVIGYPLRLDGTRGVAAENMDRFVKDLEKAFGGKVVTVDERLTSAAASKKIAAAPLSGRRKRAVIDQLAAVEIAESYRARAKRPH